jgi:hypothetical protein
VSRGLFPSPHISTGSSTNAMAHFSKASSGKGVGKGHARCSLCHPSLALGEEMVRVWTVAEQRLDRCPWPLASPSP